MLDKFGEFGLGGMPTRSRISMYGPLSCLCWSLLLIGANTQSQSQTTHSDEVSALRDIKRSLVDPNQNLGNWNRGDPCISNWTGVLCFNTTIDDGYLHVRELQLLNMDLSGNLSPALGRLSYMKIFFVLKGIACGTR